MPHAPQGLQAKADADLEKQTVVLNMKTKLAEEYDRKEKQQHVDLRMYVLASILRFHAQLHNASNNARAAKPVWRRESSALACW